MSCSYVILLVHAGVWVWDISIVSSMRGDEIIRLHVMLLNGLVIIQNFDITIPQGIRVFFLRFDFAGILLIDGTTNTLRLSRRKIPATDAQQQPNASKKYQSITHHAG